MNNEELLTHIDRRFTALEERIDTRFEKVDQRFEQVDKRFEQVDKRFEQVDKRFEQVDQRFEQVDQRFEQVDRRLEQVDQSLENLAARVNQANLQIEAVRDEVALLGETVMHVDARNHHAKEEHLREIREAKSFNQLTYKLLQDHLKSHDQKISDLDTRMSSLESKARKDEG